MNVEPGRRSTAGILKLYRAYWEFAAGRRHWIVGASALLAGSQLIKLAVPWLAAQAINTVQLQGVDGLRRDAGFVAFILAAAALSWALHGPGRIVERSIAVRVRQNLADRLYSRLADLPLTWHEVHHSGDTVQRVRQTSDAMFDFAQSQFLYLQNVVNLCGPLGAIAWFSSVLGAVALSGYAVVALVVIRFDRALMRLAQAQNQAERRYVATLSDALGSISTVLSLRLHAVTRRLMEQRLGAVFEPLRRSIVLTEWKWCGVDLLQSC